MVRAVVMALSRGVGMNTTTKPITRFDAYDVAVEIARALKPLLPLIRRGNARLGRQVVEAGSSIPMNVAEGWRRLGKDREYHYTVAAGSAAEVLAALEFAAAVGFVDAQAAAPAVALLDRELAMLHRLTHPK